MANELTKVELFGSNNDGDQINLTLASGLQVSQGQLIFISNGRNASYALMSAKNFVVVIAAEKTAGSSERNVSAWTTGVFNAVASGAISAGDSLIAGENNEVTTYVGTAQASLAAIFAKAMDSVSDGDRVNIKLI